MMAANDTNFLLVELAGSTIDATIKQVIRSYLSERRAEQDRELLQDLNPDATYSVFHIPHIDD